MKQKKLIFNFFVNRNWKKLTDSRKRAKILADNRKGHHPIETLLYELYEQKIDTDDDEECTILIIVFSTLTYVKDKFAFGWNMSQK